MLINTVLRYTIYKLRITTLLYYVQLKCTEKLDNNSLRITMQAYTNYLDFY